MDIKIAHMHGDIIEAGGVKNVTQHFHGTATPTPAADLRLPSPAIDLRLDTAEARAAWRKLCDLGYARRREGSYEWTGKTTELGHMAWLASKRFLGRGRGGAVEWKAFQPLFRIGEGELRQARNAASALNRQEPSADDAKYDAYWKMKPIFK